MKIRLTKGAYAGLVVEHNEHIAHELVRRGLAERVESVQYVAPEPPVLAEPQPEIAIVPEPVAVERAVKPRRRGGRR